MKSLLRKFHKGGNSDSGRSSSQTGASSSSSPSLSYGTDHSAAWSNASASPSREGANDLSSSRGRTAGGGGGRVTTSTTNNNNGEDEQLGEDYSFLEEEFQVQLALAISASNTDVRDNSESEQIKAAQRLSLGRALTRVRCTDYDAESLSRRYWDYNVLDYEERILDGFYDVYGGSYDLTSQDKLPSLAELQQIPVSNNLGYEVVLVNRAIDPALEQLEQAALCLALDSGTTEPGPVNSGLAQKVADIVANHMGGPVSDANDMLARWTMTSYELRVSSNNIVLLLGCLQTGLSRHRALLFKVLADHVGIPCRLVKGSHYTGIDEGAVNIIKLDFEREFIIDLMGAPGTLIPAELPSMDSAQNVEMNSMNFGQQIPLRPDRDLLSFQDMDFGQPAERRSPQKDSNPEQKSQDVLDGGFVAAPSVMLADINSHQNVGEKKVMKQNKFPGKRNEFQRRRENLNPGLGRPPLPIMRKNPFICNDVLGECDPIDGIGLRRVPETRGFNMPPLLEPSVSRSQHVSHAAASNVPSSWHPYNQSASHTFVPNMKGLPASPVVATTTVAPGKCRESPVDFPMAAVTDASTHICNENQKKMEINDLSAQDIVGREDYYNNIIRKESKDCNKKIYDKRGYQQCNDERLVCVRGTEDEQSPNLPTSVRPARLDTVLDDVAECEIPWEDLVIGERIGLGSYGEVYRAEWNGTEVAVKKFLDQDFSGDALEEFRREVRIMRRLRHPNVVLFMGAVTRPPHLSIVTEFLPRGSLYRLIHRPNIHIDEKRRIRMALDVAKGMNCLHSSIPTIVHRDLKSPNLLVDKNWAVKVCDFGLSRLKHNTFLSSKSTAGTPEWMAPEVLRNEPSNEKCDVYSFGIILWELATLRMPWSGMNPMQVVGAVGFQNRRLDIPKDLDPLVARIIRECWQSDPSLRPSFAQLMAALKPLQRLVIPPHLDIHCPVSPQEQIVNANCTP